MSKILGLDLGTNSLGWAVVETEDNKTYYWVVKVIRTFRKWLKTTNLYNKLQRL
jgi:CRISPR/Cas system Type II protein with McrA/HNH and RuvC-like nuclease domain